MEEDKVYCSKCGREMDEGYTVHDGLYNYCTDECLHSEISEDDYKYMYENGFAFWTTFYD